MTPTPTPTHFGCGHPREGNTLTYKREGEREPDLRCAECKRASDRRRGQRIRKKDDVCELANVWTRISQGNGMT